MNQVISAASRQRLDIKVGSLVSMQGYSHALEVMVFAVTAESSGINEYKHATRVGTGSQKNILSFKGKEESWQCRNRNQTREVNQALQPPSPFHCFGNQRWMSS